MKKTVQKVPIEVFNAISALSGKQESNILQPKVGFPNHMLVREVVIRSRSFFIGLHVDHQSIVTCVLFRKNPGISKKDTSLCMIVGGSIRERNFFNRASIPACSHSKTLDTVSSFAIGIFIGEVSRALEDFQETKENQSISPEVLEDIEVFTPQKSKTTDSYLVLN